MQTIRLKFTGEAALVVQSDRTADPLDEFSIKLKEVTKVKTKTIEHHREIARIEFEAGLYMGPEGPFVPGDMIQKCLVESARMQKDGKKIERGVLVTADRIPIQYDGPRTVDALYNHSSKQFIYRKTVVIAGRRTVRVRPRFPAWSIEVDVAYDERLIEKRALLAVAENAGNYIGIGQRRPNKGGSFGRFTVEEMA